MADQDEFDLAKLAAKSVRLLESLDTDEVPDPKRLYSLVKTQNRMIAGLIETIRQQNREAMESSKKMYDFAQKDSEFSRNLMNVVWRFVTIAHEKGLITDEDAARIVDSADPFAEIERWANGEHDDD